MHGADVPPCPGRASPVRPVAVVPVCQGCPLWRRFAELAAHQAPVAEHDGERWRCARRPAEAEAEAEAAAVQAGGAKVVSGEIAAEGRSPLGPGVATRRGNFFT